MSKKRWEPIRKKAIGKINSLLSLIHGAAPTEVIETFRNPETELFSTSRASHKMCNRPDWSGYFGWGANIKPLTRLFPTPNTSFSVNDFQH